MNNITFIIKIFSLAFFYFLFSFFLAVSMSVIWWRLWIYHRWFGPPEYILLFLEASGEGFYNLIYFEMLLICWFLLIIAILFFKFFVKKISE